MRFQPSTDAAKNQNAIFASTLATLKAHPGIAAMNPETSGWPISGAYARVSPDLFAGGMIRVEYRNGFKIKDTLKADGFGFDGVYSAWFKLIPAQDEAGILNALRHTKQAIVGR